MTPKNWILVALLVLVCVRIYMRMARRKKMTAVQPSQAVAAAELSQLAPAVRSENSSARNILLIARREYIERVKTKAFVVMTLLVPGAMIAIFGFSYLSATRLGSGQTLAVASSDSVLAQDVATELLAGQAGKSTSVNVIAPVMPNTQAELNSKVEAKQIDGYILLTPDPSGGPPQVIYASRVSADITGSGRISDAVSKAVTRENLSKRGIPALDLERMMKPVDVKTDVVKNGAATESNSAQSFIIADLMMVLLYFSVTYFSMNTARSVVQEKTSRIFEVMLATVRPQETMAGKMLGVGGAGLTQIAIWILAAVVLVATPLAAHMGANGLHLNVKLEQLFFFGVYFVLGFLLYSALAAALGATVSAEQEVQQFAFPLILPMLVVLTSYIFILQAPNSVYSITLSMIPFTAPLAMLLRIASLTPPLWQIALSVGIMLVTIWLVLLLAARIYRVGILMYGKRATLPEIIRWIRLA